LGRRRLIVAILFLVIGSVWVIANPVFSGAPEVSGLQDEEEETTRGIWNKKFRDARDRARAKQLERVPSENGLVGVTIWRLRDEVVDGDRSKPTAERATADTLFNDGESLRLSVEVPQANDSYLYVIDREVYADGSMSDPYLIFPSQSTPPGGNIVKAGKMVYVPAQDDPIPYFSLQRTRKDQVSEKLTIIVSPRRLKLALGTPANPSRLNTALVAQWERQWGGRVEQREERGGAGKQWTTAEIEAVDGQRRLRQGDPLPQTIYLVKTKPGGMMALQVPLKIAP
jgi:hypothetical protein